MKKDIENDNKKIILHFLNTGNYSGAENVVITIIKGIDQRFGYISYYVSVDGEINKILTENGVKHISLKKANIKELQKVIDTYKPDVIHAHDFTMGVLLAFVKSKGIRISHLHNNPPWIQHINWKTLLYGILSRQYQYILAVSQSIIEEYIFGKYIKKKYVVVDNPIDTGAIVKKALQSGEKEKCDIIFLGRLTEQKDPKRFIEIVNKIYVDNKKVKALMIGTGELENECKVLIDILNLQHHVKCIGFKENPYGYLSNAKVLCLPSKWEGFGLVIIEAFSLGIPVVATPVGGIRQLVTPEVGILSNDNDAICNEITKLLGNSEYYKKKSNAALERAKKLNNINDYMNKINMCYERIDDC